jgi:hypothetical protein
MTLLALIFLPLWLLSGSSINRFIV